MDDGVSAAENALLIGLIVLLVVGALLLFPEEVERLSRSLERLIRDLIPG